MKRPDVILSIIGGALALIVSITLAVMSVRIVLTPYDDSTPYSEPAPYEPPHGDDSPLATGDPGSPTAKVPVQCPTACFTWDDLAVVGIPVGPYYGLGLFPTGTADIEPTKTTAAAEYAAFVEEWKSTGNFADECFFTSPVSPISESLDAVEVREDPIAHIGGGTLTADGSTLEQWARVFPDTASATEYMRTLEAGLESCHRYTDANSYPTDVILRQAAIEVPDSVAALGWVRKVVSTSDRYYVTDMQRANLVIRTFGYNNGEYTDEELREVLEAAAAKLGEVPLP